MSDDEWDKRHEEYEAHVEALSKTLRTCPTHGNPAIIDKGYEGELSILANPCGCWLQAQYYDSIDETVTAWNEQPHIDALYARIAELTAQLVGVRELVTRLEKEDNAIIDNLRHQIAELEAQLAARGEWEPVNTYVNQEILTFASGDIIIINTNIQGRNITLYNSEGCEISILLRPDYAVCRRVPTEGEGDANS